MGSGMTWFSGNDDKPLDKTLSPGSIQFPNTPNRLESDHLSLDLDLNLKDSPLFSPDLDPSDCALSSTDGDSPSDDNDFSDTVLKYVNQMLMEEDMEEKPCMFHDSLALQAAEKSFHDVIAEKYQSSPNQSPSPSYADQFLVDSPANDFLSNLSDYGSNNGVSSISNSSIDPPWNGEFGESQTLSMETPVASSFVFQSSSKSSSPLLLGAENGLANSCNGMLNSDSSLRKVGVTNLLSDSDLAWQFKRGVEEANNFLPKGNRLVIDLETDAFAPEMSEKASEVVMKQAKEEAGDLLNWLRGKKNHEREEEDFEEDRRNKQSAVHADESELSEMFDKILLFDMVNCKPLTCVSDEAPQNVLSRTSQQNRKNGSNGGRTQAKKRGNKKDVVDLRTLLVLCAQAVSSNDLRMANEFLSQIRQHASPFGDGSQRLAHYFANGLEARLAGTGSQIYTALSTEKTSAVDMLKAYQAFILACPFRKLAIVFANHNIMSAAEKATTLHIIDFGILYGFQWPPLIYRLSKRPGGPPKLRITGIELPQSGFRPAERVQETGNLLATYCERYSVPFEYNAIAQKWETIQIDDLKINHGEFLAVNCLFRFRNLLDETVVVNSPKNAVLNIIRKANPDIFTHAVVNGSYNSPYFVPRFREALFHFSSMFDMCDTNMSHEDPMRLKFEKEFYGREAMNVIACEGSERVERPETYKQWQVRNTRAGLRQLPLDTMVMKKLKWKVKAYHSDFAVDIDGHWVLQEWKGRIVYASSAWIPA